MFRLPDYLRVFRPRGSRDRIVYSPPLSGIDEDLDAVLRPDLSDRERARIERRVKWRSFYPYLHWLIGGLVGCVLVTVVTEMWSLSWVMFLALYAAFMVATLVVPWVWDQLFFRTHRDRVVLMSQAMSNPSFVPMLVRVRDVALFRDFDQMSEDEFNRVAWAVWDVVSSNRDSLGDADWSPVFDECDARVKALR